MKATSNDAQPMPKATPPQAVDKVKKGAKYGDKPQNGEQRIDVSEYLKPLASYKHGTNYVPKTGIALLHKGEAVTPAKDNPMSNVFDKVPGRSTKPAKKEIKHIITSKTHDGKYLHKHVHHHPEHEDETHVSNDLAELKAHMGAASGEGAGDAPQMTASPSPDPTAAAGAPAGAPGTAPTAVPGM
jgi:hypothetical protein